jgi:sterol desaturase/sphingolipid hydroxylase (fatty acid hydroxylase superfamily)
MDLRVEMRRMRWKWWCVGCWRSKIPEIEEAKLQNSKWILFFCFSFFYFSFFFAGRRRRSQQSSVLEFAGRHTRVPRESEREEFYFPAIFSQVIVAAVLLLVWSCWWFKSNKLGFRSWLRFCYCLLLGCFIVVCAHDHSIAGIVPESIHEI